MKSINNKVRSNKWQSIINRCFGRNPSESQLVWLHKLNKEVKERGSLSKRQAIVLVRIARGLKAYYPEKRKLDSLDSRLQRIKSDKIKNQKPPLSLEERFIGIKKPSSES